MYLNMFPNKPLFNDLFSVQFTWLYWKKSREGNGTRWNRESNYLSVDVCRVSPWTSRWLECSGCKAQNERKSKFVHFQVTVYACNFRMNRFYLCKDICSLCPADSAWKRMLMWKTCSGRFMCAMVLTLFVCFSPKIRESHIIRIIWSLYVVWGPPYSTYFAGRRIIHTNYKDLTVMRNVRRWNSTNICGLFSRTNAFA